MHAIFAFCHILAPHFEQFWLTKVFLCFACHSCHAVNVPPCSQWPWFGCVRTCWMGGSEPGRMTPVGPVGTRGAPLGDQTTRRALRLAWRRQNSIFHFTSQHQASPEWRHEQKYPTGSTAWETGMSPATPPPFTIPAWHHGYNIYFSVVVGLSLGGRGNCPGERESEVWGRMSLCLPLCLPHLPGHQ